jgi:hypothetical protein
MQQQGSHSSSALGLGTADIALIHEPWVQDSQIRGLGGTIMRRTAQSKEYTFV